MNFAVKAEVIVDREFHPIANIWPLMSDDELLGLASDIEKNGQHHPIVLYQNKILDGRNRWNACKLAGITPKTLIATLKDDDEAIALALSLNESRRHLNLQTRAIAAAKLCNLRVGLTVKNADSSGELSESQPMARASKAFHVSIASIKRAKQLIAYGDSGIVEAVTLGQLPLRTALRRCKQLGLELPPTPRPARKPKPKPEALPRGPRIRLQNGETFVELYRRASALPGSTAEKARAVGIFPQSYRSIEAVVLLAERTDLSPVDAEHAKDALALLERYGQPTNAFKKIQSIARRIWHHKQSRRRPHPNVEKFGRQLAVVEQVAQCGDAIVFPYLSVEARESALQIVKESIAALIRLKRRLEKSGGPT